MLQRGGAALTPAGTCSASVRAKAVQTPHGLIRERQRCRLCSSFCCRTECSRLF